MVEAITPSIVDWEKHLIDIADNVTRVYGKEYTTKFLDYYRQRYSKFNRAFIDYELAFIMTDEYYKLEKEGTRWYACVGPRRTGKSTLMQNVCYYMDDSFDLNRVNLGIYNFIKKLSEFPTRKAMKSLFMDEPDNTFHTASKQGRVLKDVITKMGQQHMFCGICSTTLTAIPNYIWKEIDGVFFLPFKGQGMFFRNEPEKKKYPIQMIREEYGKKGYEVFFELMGKGLTIPFRTSQSTPFDSVQLNSYLDNKEDDYKDSIKLAMETIKPKDVLTEKQREVVELRKRGYGQVEIAKMLGISQPAVSNRENGAKFADL